MKKQEKKKNWQRKENITGYLFILPYLTAFIIFTGIPFLIAMGLSFVNVKYITQLDNLRFVGLGNFVRMFNDKETMASLFRTFKYSAIYVPLIMVAGFLLAYIVNKGIYLKNTVRAMLFLPYVSNMVAVAVVFKVLLGPGGPLITLLQRVGVESPTPPLLDLKMALPTVVCVAVWKGIGLNMITYLGALQNVPGELLEAAQIDGANKWQQIRNVVIPMVSPTTFFLIISSIITSLQNFTVIQSLTGGGPGQETTVMAINIVRTAFTKYETSYASAQALVVFAVVMVITVIQWVGQKKWVNY